MRRHFWGTELGLNILSRNGTKVGLKAFYEASRDIQAVGGNAFLKIPFADLMTSTMADSGIRVVRPKRMLVKLIFDSCEGRLGVSTCNC